MSPLDPGSVGGYRPRQRQIMPSDQGWTEGGASLTVVVSGYYCMSHGIVISTLVTGGRSEGAHHSTMGPGHCGSHSPGIWHPPRDRLPLVQCAFFVCSFSLSAPIFWGVAPGFFPRKFPCVSGISIQRNVLPIRCEIAHTAAAPVFFRTAPEFFLVDFHVLGGSTVKLNVFSV